MVLIFKEIEVIIHVVLYRKIQEFFMFFAVNLRLKVYKASKGPRGFFLCQCENSRKSQYRHIQKENDLYGRIPVLSRFERWNYASKRPVSTASRSPKHWSPSFYPCSPPVSQGFPSTSTQNPLSKKTGFFRFFLRFASVRKSFSFHWDSANSLQRARDAVFCWDRPSPKAWPSFWLWQASPVYKDFQRFSSGSGSRLLFLHY